MNIAFDALPLMGSKSGVGWCEAGQVRALTRLYPENRYTLNYFAMRHMQERRADIAPYLQENTDAHHVYGSPYGYRVASHFVPVPYRWFFGKSADLTHFFNYIVPPGVHGKTVVTVHDMAFRVYPETVRGRTRRMLETGLVPSMRRADRIVTVSEFSKQEILRFYPEFADKLRVVPNGVDLQRFCQEEDPDEITRVRRQYGLEKPYFLYLGNIEPRKNLERLISAYAKLVGELPDPPRLVLAGGAGWLNEGIFGRVKRLGLEGQVIFTEYITAENLRPLLCGALAFVFPSLYEGFGMPPLEAMACGTPVLTANAASLPEVTGDSAVLVRPDSTASIARGLYLLATDEKLRALLRRRGPERARLFTWEHSARILYGIYKELL